MTPLSLLSPHQPADPRLAVDVARRIGADDETAHVAPDQAPDAIARAVHHHVLQPEVANLGAGARGAEQPSLARPFAVQAGDGAAVALELGVEARVRAADRFPAGGEVPEGVAIADGAAAVGVEVQVGGQLVAGAACGGAAHAGDGGEGRCVGVFAGRGGHAVAVQVVAHRVQLVQVPDLDEPVVVVVVVAEGQRLGERIDPAYSGRTRSGCAGAERVEGGEEAGPLDAGVTEVVGMGGAVLIAAGAEGVAEVWVALGLVTLDNGSPSRRRTGRRSCPPACRHRTSRSSRPRRRVPRRGGCWCCPGRPRWRWSRES